MSDPQQEYADALAGYREAMARLQEAKRHIPQSPRDRYRQHEREKREAERAHYLAHKDEIDTQFNQFCAQSLAILHQQVNQYLGAAEEAEAKLGDTLRIRLPISYRINNGPPIGNDNE